MKTFTLFLALVISCPLWIGASPQESQTTVKSGTVTLSADQVVSDSTIGSFKGRGSASADVHNGKFKFQADEIEISIDSDKGMISVLLRGNVRSSFIQDDGSTRNIDSNQMHFNIKLVL